MSSEDEIRASIGDALDEIPEERQHDAPERVSAGKLRQGDGVTVRVNDRAARHIGSETFDAVVVEDAVDNIVFERGDGERYTWYPDIGYIHGYHEGLDRNTDIGKVRYVERHTGMGPEFAQRAPYARGDVVRVDGLDASAADHLGTSARFTVRNVDWNIGQQPVSLDVRTDGGEQYRLDLSTKTISVQTRNGELVLGGYDRISTVDRTESQRGRRGRRGRRGSAERMGSEISKAIQEQMDTIGDTLVHELRLWGATRVDSWTNEHTNTTTTDFHVPDLPEGPQRSSLVTDDAFLEEATIRLGVLDNSLFDQHPSRDVPANERLEAVASRANPPHHWKVTTDFGDFHYPPRPHIRINRYTGGGDVFEDKGGIIKKVQPRNMDARPPNASDIIDFLERAVEEVEAEFGDEMDWDYGGRVGG